MQIVAAATMGLAPSSHLPNTHFQGSSAVVAAAAAAAAAAAVAGWGLGKEPETEELLELTKIGFI